MLDKGSVDELASNLGISRRKLNYWFAPFRDMEFAVEKGNCKDKYLVIDGFVHSGETTLVAAVGPHEVISWSFVQRENATAWREFLSTLDKPLVVVGDGQKGMIKAIKQIWPDVVFQRCRFHVYNYNKRKLKANPRSIAAKSLKTLTVMATKIDNFDDLHTWLKLYNAWQRECGDFVQEKTYYINSRGRKCWHYTHKDLHAAYSHLKNALPNLFQFLWFAGLPATSNILEGGINSPMREHLYTHRGASLQTQRQIISVFLRSRRR